MGMADFRQEPQPFNPGCNSFEPGPQQSTVSIQGALPASPQTIRRQTRSLTVAQQAAGDEYPVVVADVLIVKEPKPEPQTDIAEISVGDPLSDQDFLAGSDAIWHNDGSSGKVCTPSCSVFYNE